MSDRVRHERAVRSPKHFVPPSEMFDLFTPKRVKSILQTLLQNGRHLCGCVEAW